MVRSRRPERGEAARPAPPGRKTLPEPKHTHSLFSLNCKQAHHREKLQRIGAWTASEGSAADTGEVSVTLTTRHPGPLNEPEKAGIVRGCLYLKTTIVMESHKHFFVAQVSESFCPERLQKVKIPRSFYHRENGGTLGMVPLMINPIYTLCRGYLLQTGLNS